MAQHNPKGLEKLKSTEKNSPENIVFSEEVPHDINTLQVKQEVIVNPEDFQHNSFINFLMFPGFIKTNLVPEDDGTINFSVDGQRYANIFAIVIDDYNITQIQLSTPSIPEMIWKKNISLKKSLDTKTYYNEGRKVTKLTRGAKHEIKDLTSVKFRIVDSFEKVKNMQLKIAERDGCNINSDLLFLTSWNKFTEAQKLQKFNQFFCHEMNLFLYFKDKNFFNKVIKGFIKNKHEKSLIDHWLLGEYDRIKKYHNVQYFENLNSIEKILIIYLVAQEDQATAKILAKRIEMNSRLTQEGNDYRNYCFDAVFKSGNVQDKSGQKEKVKLAETKDEEDPSFQEPILKDTTSSQVQSSSMSETNFAPLNPSLSRSDFTVFKDSFESNIGDENAKEQEKNIYPSEY